MDFDLLYQTSDGDEFELFRQTPVPDAPYLAFRTSDQRASCSAQQTEAFTFTRALGRNDVSAELYPFSKDPGSFNGNNGGCAPTAAVRAVNWGVELASRDCSACLISQASPTLALDTSFVSTPCQAPESTPPVFQFTVNGS